MLLCVQHAACGRLHLPLCPTMHCTGTVLSVEQRKNNRLTVFDDFYYIFHPVEGGGGTRAINTSNTQARRDKN